jgi:hypothetical protein
MNPDARARFVGSLVVTVVAVMVGLFGIFLKFQPAITGNAPIRDLWTPANIFFGLSYLVLLGVALYGLLSDEV